MNYLPYPICEGRQLTNVSHWKNKKYIFYHRTSNLSKKIWEISKSSKKYIQVVLSNFDAHYKTVLYCLKTL